MAMGDVIGRLSVVLGLDTAAFETGARRASKVTGDTGDRMEQLGAKVGFAAKAMVGFGVAIAGSQLVQQVKDMAIAGFQHASALGEQAQQLGVTTGELQKYRFIATQVGIDQDVMDKGLAKLSVTLGDLANGAKLPTAALERLGLSQQQIAQVSQMTAGQAIPFLADSFAKLKSPTEAAAIAADLFGAKMGGKFLTLLMGGKAGIDQLTVSYQKLGIEISEGQIAKADEAMDKFAAMQEVFKARQAQAAADNAEGVLAGLGAWEEFKTKAIVIFGQVITGYNDLQKASDELAAKIPDPFETLGAVVDWVDAKYVELRESVKASARAIYEGVKTWLSDKLNAVWAWVIAKIETVKTAFFNLYDAVVGHSYVPDMVDGIADQMMRLDRVMVEPAKKATEAVKGFFKDLDRDVRGFMDELFPGARDMADFQNKLAKFDEGIRRGGAGGFDADQLRAGRSQLIAGADTATLRGTPLPLADQLARFGNIDLGNTGPISNALKSITDAANDNADDLGVANVRIAKSFQDMADQTLSALDRMANAVKGGGFLDILGAVIGLGLQLGSLGLFGKGIQTNLGKTSIPGFASGTSFAPGGLALVGERGPELVNLPRGSQVIPNHALNSGGGTRVEVVPSPYFDVRVQENIDSRAPGIAAAGAQGGAARVFNSQRRRVA